jgi:hypothetical protein
MEKAGRIEKVFSDLFECAGRMNNWEICPLLAAIRES